MIFRSKGAFWIGFTAVAVGVALQLPMYINAADMGYRLVGMKMSTTMNLGMLLVVVGLFITLYSLVPSSTQKEHTGYDLKVRALDDVPLNLTHVGLLIVMAIAITLDVMKPTILSFVVPGVAREYGLRSPVNPHASIPVALLPLSGITGTVLGSFLWGWMGDKIGRKASILMAGITFIATSSCGSMPSFWMNCVMCLIMGWGVGGMLPIMFTLMAESIPARHRGWLMVLLGGDIAGAYIISSSLASWLVPHYSWRILWLIGFPTGFILILLNRWIPESPRYLLNQGRLKEAQDVMKRFGAVAVKETISSTITDPKIKDKFRHLFRPPFLGITATMALLALGGGFVQFGFELWIPSNLQHMGLSEAGSFELLRNAALIGFPLNFVIAWMYGFWSSKRTIILLTLLTAASMLGFLFAGNSIIHHRVLLYILLIIPIWGISSVISVLSAYAAEVYPTRVRSRGSGLIAGFSKFGGVLVIAVVVLAIAPPSIAVTALVGAIPLILAAIAITLYGVETQKRKLEDITEEQFRAVEIIKEKN
ncbi:MFS transporter [Mucilaginibacter segetis]|uniref:MFS transporter n=1 Tax=Mucilaginibacter segetis TaxID=2793071 RepID=A0A934PSV9_9SPHI|nr:MFS transporter [Mucilaginibacter segetis]MBK0378425.1 MFS transporter [Mucilaginibacter segetis]